jgi:hypothetical protein
VEPVAADAVAAAPGAAEPEVIKKGKGEAEAAGEEKPEKKAEKKPEKKEKK